MTSGDQSDSKKLQYIEIWFDDFDDRVQFLVQLWEDGRQDEALTLCCAYIDAIGGFLAHPKGCRGGTERHL